MIKNDIKHDKNDVYNMTQINVNHEKKDKILMQTMTEMM